MVNALNFPLSLFISIVLIPLLMRYAGPLGLVDTPDGIRKIHVRSIPKSGGLAIAIAVFIPVIYSWGQVSELIPLMAAALIIVIFGYLDDRYELHYKWKFFGQILAIMVFIIGTPQLVEEVHTAGDDLYYWAYWSIIFLFLLGASNAINLSDGLDGLAAGVTFISLGLISFIAFEADLSSVMLVALTVMGALMGFLRYNTHPARVFMGDTGSQFIGFTSAALAVYLAQSSVSAINPVLPLLILGLPIMDTLMVMVVRMYSGKSPFYPDKNHIHHQLMKFGFRHYEAVAVLYILQIILVLICFSARFSHTITLLLIYIVFVLSCLGTLYLAHYHKWQIRGEHQWQIRPECVVEQFVERRNPYLRNLRWLYEHNATIILIAVCGLWFVMGIATIEYHASVQLLALILLLGSFLFGIFFPAKVTVATRILAYSATVLSLYAFSIADNTNHYGLIVNGILLFIGLFTILAIRLTRKELFQLNNQDLIILFLLLLCPLLPIEGEDGVKIGVMLFRTLVIIYAIEYLISKSPHKNIWVRIFSSLTLFSLCFF